MDGNRVAAEFKRIQTVATLEKQREIIASYQEGLAYAWTKVEEAQSGLGYLKCQLQEGMNLDEPLKALRAVNRAMIEDHRIDCLEHVKQYEAMGSEHMAQCDREAVAKADAALAAGKY